MALPRYDSISRDKTHNHPLRQDPGQGLSEPTPDGPGSQPPVNDWAPDMEIESHVAEVMFKGELPERPGMDASMLRIPPSQ